MKEKKKLLKINHLKRHFKTILLIITLHLVYCKSQLIEYLSEEDKIKRCPNKKPKDQFDCNAYSTSKNYCCYLYLTNEIAELYNNTISNKFCLSLEKEKYNKLGNINYMNVNYRIECGIGTQIFSSSQSAQAGANCGISNPKKASDCFSGSNINNHCCYYKISNITGCYYLGAKFSGVYNDVSGGYYYECEADFIIGVFGMRKFLVFILALGILI